ncbi:MAG: FKBP-type peptidyl-prolyl cis-trans isomerase [Polaribacter sp.]
MKTIKNLVLITLLSTLVSCNHQKADVKSLESEKDSAIYALGINVAKYYKTNFDEDDINLFYQSMRNRLDSTNLLIEDKDVQNILRTYFQKQQQIKREEELAKAEVYKQEGIAFLEENKTKEGVKTTESGLQYTVLKEGAGKRPEATAKVKIHYHGTLLDGTVFDSSVDKNKPIEMGVNQFVKGFSEGLQLMKEGAKYKFFIPQELGYGATPRQGGKIKPYMAIIFEVELLEIKK